MTKDEAIQHFGTQVALSEALGINQGTVSSWVKVPILRQLQLEALTEGQLKADAECEPFKVQAA